jgi:hypothetical protein
LGRLAANRGERNKYGVSGGKIMRGHHFENIGPSWEDKTKAVSK